MIISLNGIFCIVALTSFSMIPRLVGESVLGFRTCRLSAAWAVLVASRAGRRAARTVSGTISGGGRTAGPRRDGAGCRWPGRWPRAADPPIGPVTHSEAGYRGHSHCLT